MPNSLPFSILASWIGLVALASAQIVPANVFEGSSIGRLFSRSLLVAFIAGMALWINYFIKVEWYWALSLLVIGSALGILVSSVVEAIIGRIITIISFAWPACAVWFYYAMKAIPK